MATALVVGDIAILGLNADNPDDFSFVTFAWIEAGTQISFTDGGWLAAGGFRGGEGTAVWTAPSDIVPGTVINLTVNAADFTNSTALSTAGDQLIAYTGAAATPNVLFAVNTDKNIWDADATSSTTSALPTGLVDDVTGMSVGATAATDFDNVQYNNSLSTGEISALKASIFDALNWNGSNIALTQATAALTVSQTALTGTAASETLTTGGGANEALTDQQDYDGGGGTDTVDYSAAINRLTLDLSDATGLSNTNAAYGDTFANVERFKLTTFDDTFIGSAGNDIVLDAGGADSYDGGAGSDEVSYLDAGAAVTINLTDATGASNTGFALNDTYTSIEKYRLSDFADTFTSSNGVGDVSWASGMDGDDTFNSGTTGSTSIFWGGNGQDAVVGSSGFTVFYGGADNDTLTGGTGVDRLVGSLGNDQLDGGDNNDYGNGGAGNDTLNGDAGNDNLLGGADADVLNGGTGIDTLRGGSGIDTLNGDAGNDKMYGDSEADLMAGGEGNDYMRGGTGGDFLTGGMGNDSMYGGADADTFIFNSTDTGADYIWDFTDNVDTLQFNGLTAGDISGVDNVYGNAIITIGTSGATIQVRGISYADLLDDMTFV